MPHNVELDHAAEFIRRWESSGAAERANYQLFLSELCDILDAPRPEPTVPHDSQNSYVFERAVQFHDGDGTTTLGRIDLYKKGCFVLEAKQGSIQLVLPIANVLAEEQQPLDAGALTRIFTRARKQDVQEIAETLVSLNQARRVETGYTA